MQKLKEARANLRSCLTEFCNKKYSGLSKTGKTISLFRIIFSEILESNRQYIQRYFSTEVTYDSSKSSKTEIFETISG